MRKILSLLCVLMLASGCSGSSTAGPTTTIRSSTSAPQPEATLAFVAPDIAEIRLALIKPGSMLPTEAYLESQSAVVVSDLLYDGLTAISAQGQLVPAIANEWEAANDLTQWRFSIGNDTPVPPSYVARFFQDQLGNDGSLFTSAVLANVESVSASNREVTFELFSPDGGFPWLLAGLPFSIVGEEGATTGRYEIETSTDDVLVLNAVSSGPQISITWQESALDAYDLLTLGFVDAAVADPLSVLDSRSRFASQPKPLSSTTSLVLNSRSPNLASAATRLEVVKAIDRDVVVSEAFVDATSVHSVLSPALAGASRAKGCGEACEHDDGAPLDRLTELTVGYVADRHEQVATLVGSELETAGSSVVVRQYDVTGAAAAVLDGSIDVYVVDWVAPSGSVDAVASYLLHPDSSLNIAQINSEAVGEKIETGRSVERDELRWQHFAEAESLALQQGLIVPLVATNSQIVSSAGMAEYVAFTPDGGLDLTVAGLD